MMGFQLTSQLCLGLKRTFKEPVSQDETHDKQHDHTNSSVVLRIRWFLSLHSWGGRQGRHLVGRRMLSCRTEIVVTLSWNE